VRERLGLATREAWQALSEEDRLDWLAFDYKRQQEREDIRREANKLVKSGKYWDSMTYLSLHLQTLE
jgi:hypothetical protein